jgi:hypothetical protein
MCTYCFHCRHDTRSVQQKPGLRKMVNSTTAISTTSLSNFFKILKNLGWGKPSRSGIGKSSIRWLVDYSMCFSEVPELIRRGKKRTRSEDDRNKTQPVLDTIFARRRQRHLQTINAQSGDNPLGNISNTVNNANSHVDGNASPGTAQSNRRQSNPEAGDTNPDNSNTTNANEGPTQDSNTTTASSRGRGRAAGRGRGTRTANGGRGRTRQNAR